MDDGVVLFGFSLLSSLGSLCMNVSVRKVSDVKLTSEYLRKGTDVSKLKKSLQSVGLIHPVTVNAANELMGLVIHICNDEAWWHYRPVLADHMYTVALGVC